MPKFARPNSYTGKQSNQSWTGSTRAANTVEAAAGVDAQLYISPLTLAESLTGLVPHASTTVFGVVQLTDNHQPVATKYYADNLAIAGATPWSESVSGIGQLSTTLEATTGTDDNTAMTPLKVNQVLTGGSSSPSFTNVLISGTLGVTGLTSLNGSASIVTGATALNLGADNSTGAVNIGTGAGARNITIGNITGATAVAVNTGTGSFTVSTTTAGDIVLNSADTVLIDSAGVLELNSSAGVIGIGNDAVAQNINIGTGAAARVITLGNGSGATQVVVNAGTAGVNIGTNAIEHTVTIGNQTSASAVVIDSGTGPINIGTTIAKVITIGNVTGVSGVAVNVGTGNFSLNGAPTSDYNVGAATTTGTITIGGTNQTGTISIAPGTSVQTVNIANSNTGVKTVNIATGSVGNIVTIGSSKAAASLSLFVGTGNFSLDGAPTSTYTFAPSSISGTINFGGTAASTGTMTIAGGTGTQTVNIASNSGIKTVNIGVTTDPDIINIGTGGTATHTVNVGSTSSASTVVLNSGSGNVNVTGGHLSIATVAKTLLVNGGAVTDFIGTGVLTAGTQTIANTNIQAGDVILLTRIGVQTSTTLGILTYTISNGVSFTVTSVILGTPGLTQTDDVSTYAYFIVRPT